MSAIFSICKMLFPEVVVTSLCLSIFLYAGILVLPSGLLGGEEDLPHLGVGGCGVIGVGGGGLGE